MPSYFCVAEFCAQLGCQPVSGALLHALLLGILVGDQHSSRVVVVACFEHSSPDLCLPSLYYVHAQ